MTNAASEGWQFGGRAYATALVSDVHTRDGMGLELYDVAPAPARGTVLEAFHDDATGEMAFTAHVTDPLPLELVERFIAEARPAPATPQQITGSRQKSALGRRHVRTYRRQSCAPVINLLRAGAASREPFADARTSSKAEVKPVAYRRAGAGFGAAVSVIMLAGCAASDSHAGAETTSVRQRQISYALYTHCGIDEARVGSTYYVADHPLSDGQGNPPPGWGNPYQHGRMTISAPGVAVFRDRLGHVVRFHARAHATSFLHICS